MPSVSLWRSPLRISFQNSSEFCVCMFLMVCTLMYIWSMGLHNDAGPKNANEPEPSEQVVGGHSLQLPKHGVDHPWVFHDFAIGLGWRFHSLKIEHCTSLFGLRLVPHAAWPTGRFVPSWVSWKRRTTSLLSRVLAQGWIHKDLEAASVSGVPLQNIVQRWWNLIRPWRSLMLFDATRNGLRNVLVSNNWPPDNLMGMSCTGLAMHFWARGPSSPFHH